jgi:hypothetical protein
MLQPVPFIEPSLRGEAVAICRREHRKPIRAVFGRACIGTDCFALLAMTHSGMGRFGTCKRYYFDKHLFSMTFRKLIGKLHLWLGLGSGVIVFIVSITGCLYVFETEIRSLYEYPFTQVQPVKQPLLSVSELRNIGKKALEEQTGKAANPEYHNVTLYKDAAKAAYYYAYHEK